MSSSSTRLLMLVAPACVIALGLACFQAVLFRGHQFAYRDAGHFYYPLYQRVQQEWAAGRLPLWEPEENSGMPLLGNPTAAVLYPGKLIYAVAPDYAWGVRLYTIAHALLALGAMYALVRHWGISRTGAWIAATSYAFGAPILFQYCNIIFLVGAAWAPLAIRAIDRWLRLGRFAAVGELGVVLAMQTLGGDPQAAYLEGLCAGGYALGLWWASRPGRRCWPGWALLIAWLVGLGAWSALVLYAAAVLPDYRPPSRPPSRLPWMSGIDLGIRIAWGLAGLALLAGWLRRPGRPLGLRLVGLIGAAGLAGLLAAVQLLPVLEFTSKSARAAGSGPHDIYPFSVEPARLAEFAFPGLFGQTQVGNTSWLPLVPPRHPPDIWVPSLYVGGLTLVLALAAGGFRKGPPWRAWLTGILLVSLVGSLGKFGSPLWVGRMFEPIAGAVGPPDAPDDAAIRFDGKLRDGDGGLYWLLSTVLPGFREFRYPAKLLTFACLALSALAGAGWDRVAVGRRGRATAAATAMGLIGLIGGAVALAFRPRLVAAFEAADLGGSVFGPFEPAGAALAIASALGYGGAAMALALLVVRLARSAPARIGAVALVAMAVDLAVTNSPLVLTAPQSMFEGTPKLLQLIRQFEEDDPTPGGLYRVHRMPIWEPLGWRDIPNRDRHRQFVEWERKTLQPKYGIPYGLQYTQVEGTAELYDYMFFLASFEGIHDRALSEKYLGDRSKRLVAFARRGFDLWNTRYFVIPYQIANDEHRGFASFLFGSEVLMPPRDGSVELEDWEKAEDWQILRNEAYYPRAWTVHKVNTIAPISGLRREDRVEIMENILFQNDPLWNLENKHVYDLRSEAWVETDDPAAVRDGLDGRPPAASELPRITRYEPQRVEMEVTLNSPGVVILADVHYPGWRLTIDDKPATILRANRLMRGAKVGAGTHTLVYTYDPPLVKIGASLSAFGLFALAAVGLWSWRRPNSRAIVPDEVIGIS